MPRRNFKPQKSWMFQVSVLFLLLNGIVVRHHLSPWLLAVWVVFVCGFGGWVVWTLLQSRSSK
jgi:drug/metabolite transporter (DMT)-like permease